MPDFSNQIDQLKNLNQIAEAQNVTINNFNQAKDAAQQARVQVMPPFKPLLYPIIGRDDLIDQISAALKAGQRSVAVLHLPGIGKTTLAAMLAKNTSLQERFPDGVLWAHLGLDPDVRAELRKWAYALNVPESRMKDFETPAQWSEAVAQAIGNRRMLLIVDDVWETETAGDYFLLGGDACAHVVTTRYPSVAASMTEISFGVRKLDNTEGITLLRSFAPDAVDAEPAAAADLVESVDGLPLALVLMGHYLKQAGKFKQVGRIRAALDALHDIENLFQLEQPPEYPADTPRSLASVIETSYRALGKCEAWQLKRLPGDELRRTLESLSILRADPARFRAELAERVSGVSRSALDALCDAGLIEVVHTDTRNDEDGERYTMHRTVAEYIRTKLAPERAKTLHLCAAAYYREKLNELEERYQQGAGYQGWYRYENIEWQNCKDDWLYHLAHTDEKNLSTLVFLRAWFDGFWWWGCFLDFNFCDQLLRE
ncbi:MAG TPA: NB-ARC domain-containing protein, partial [Rhodocyclaceae bacterium]|nr:NB-ARC domain-containing protein [Rhodocyclaceae bacterium]